MTQSVRATVRAAMDAGLRRSPVQLIFRRSAANRLAVLAYHGVDHPEMLDRQLRHLRRVAEPVALDRVVDAVTDGSPLPPRSVLVTFDDGHRSVLEKGLPVLRRHNVPAVAFVLPGLVDTDRPFWWSEVDWLVRSGATAGAVRGLAPAAAVRRLKMIPDVDRRRVIDELRSTASEAAPDQPQLTTAELRLLTEAGVAVANHTMTHPCLDRCEAGILDHEIRAAHHLLTEVLSRPPDAFAYPNGNWDARAETLLSELGYRVAFLFDHLLSANPPRHALRISRLRVNSDTSLDRFASIVSGMHPALHHARGGA